MKIRGPKAVRRFRDTAKRVISWRRAAYGLSELQSEQSSGELELEQPGQCEWQ